MVIIKANGNICGKISLLNGLGIPFVSGCQLSDSKGGVRASLTPHSQWESMFISSRFLHIRLDVGPKHKSKSSGTDKREPSKIQL